MGAASDILTSSCHPYLSGRLRRIAYSSWDAVAWKKAAAERASELAKQNVLLCRFGSRRPTPSQRFCPMVIWAFLILLLAFFLPSSEYEIAHVAASVLILYDAIITLDLEVRLVWARKNKRSLATLIYVTNRVLSLCYALSGLLKIPNWTRISTCTGLFILNLILSSLLLLVFAGFSALRVYAFGGGARTPSALVFIVCLVPLAISLYLNITVPISQVVLGDNLRICVYAEFLRESRMNTLEIIGLSFLLLGDAIVLAITWSKTFSIIRQARSSKTNASTLVRMILRNGSVYFLYLLMNNVGVLVTSIYGNVNMLPLDLAPAWTSIMVSRFLLALRAHDSRRSRRADALTSTLGSQLSDMRFAPSWINDMGGELEDSLNPTDPTE